MTDKGRKVLHTITQWYSKGSIGFDDLLVLIEYCDGKETVVELGTNTGSTARLLSILAGSVYTVDVFESTYLIEDAGQREVYQKSFEKNGHTFKAVCETLDQYSNIIVINGVSYSVAEGFCDSSIDVIFIDADHSFTGVKKDYESWFSKIKPNGVFLFHDMIEAFACFKFYNENLLFDSRIEEIKHDHDWSSIKIFRKRAQ